MTDGDNPKSKVRQMLTAEHVLALIPVSRSTLFRLERDRLFPLGQAITPHRKLWFEHEVIAWQEALLDPNSALSQALKLRVAKKKTRSRLPQPKAGPLFDRIPLFDRVEGQGPSGNTLHDFRRGDGHRLKG